MDANSEFYSFKKVVIFGGSKVGKKSLLKKIEGEEILGNEPEDNEEENEKEEEESKNILINLGFWTKRVFLKNKDGVEFSLDFYSVTIPTKTQSEQNYKDLINGLLFQCQCVLFMIDISSKESFEEVKEFKEKVMPEFKSEFLTPILLSNKMDLESNRAVSGFELKEFTDANPDLQVHEMSIKTGDNYQELIELLYNVTHSNHKIPSNYITKCVRGSNPKLSRNENSLRVVLLGDSSVGKTALMNRYFKNDFKEGFMSTIGISDETIFVKVRGIVYKLTVWDTAGQERFRSLPKSYYQNADGICLLFDVTSKKSFDNLESGWMTEIREHTKKQTEEGMTPLTIYLVGNKTDQIEKREVSRSLGEQKAKELKTKYIEISCKLNLNITELIDNLTSELVSKAHGGKDFFTLQLEDQVKKQNKCCSGEKGKK